MLEQRHDNQRFRSFSEAVFQTERNGALWVTPFTCSHRMVDAEVVEQCRLKGLRVYLEMPEGLGEVERLPASSRGFVREVLGGLCVGSLLDFHGGQFVHVASSVVPLVSAAVVAGYDKLAYGIPPDSHPILFRHPAYEHLLIATVPLSRHLEGRFAPISHWRLLWDWICGQMGNHPSWVDGASPVRPSYGKQDVLPSDAISLCVERAFCSMERSFLYREDGVLKVAEGFSGVIAPDGSQPWRRRERADCMVETAAAFGVAALLGGNRRYGELAEEIVGRMLSDPGHMALNPEDPCTGQVTFYDHVRCYYSSDNGQTSMLLALMWSLSPDRVARGRCILRMMLSVLRCTGRQGHCHSSFRVPRDFQDHMWDWYGREDFLNNCPHRQAAVWSMFIVGWKLTGYDRFLELAEVGIGHLMSVYPDLLWTNEYSAELAKMLRPLSFLYRARPTSEHRLWLMRVCDDVLSRMDSCGAVRVTLGAWSKGMYPPPSSNEEYGSREASIVQTGEESCCDLLYTQVFAFAGMHEAYIATGEARYRAARDRMGEFLVRIQIASESHPEISGLWMRAFDFERWEYWGSSADGDWGAWCIESGWTNAPAVMVFLLQAAGKGMYDLLPPDLAFREHLPGLLKELEVMYPVPEADEQERKADFGEEENA